jgi:hypothetical protein
MQEEINNPLTPEQREMESRLSTLRPAAPQIDRDALIYVAGHAAGRKTAQRQLWPLRIACSLLIALTVALALWRPSLPEMNTPRGPILSAAHSTPATPEVVSYDVTPPASFNAITLTASTDSNSYLHLRERILLLGLSALPPVGETSHTPPAPSSPDTFDASPASQRKILSSSGEHS